MDQKEFLSKIDHDRVIAAIRGAEQETSGEIRVHVQPRAGADIRMFAEKTFERLGMTRQRNATEAAQRGRFQHGQSGAIPHIEPSGSGVDTDVVGVLQAADSSHWLPVAPRFDASTGALCDDQLSWRREPRHALGLGQALRISA